MYTKMLLIFAILRINRDYAEAHVDLTWYNHQVTSNVVPPYRNAYAILSEQIVQRLLNATDDMDEVSMKTMIHSLVCGSRNLETQLTVSTKAIEDVRVKLDSHILSVTNRIHNQENQVHENQMAVNQANSHLQSIQQQVAVAENAVRDREIDLNAAEHRYREAEKEVEKARRCGIGRRRKRFIGGWWRKHVEKPVVKVFRNTVIKPVCSVINSGGIDNAKHGREMASQSLQEARQRLAHFQRSLSEQRDLHNQAQKRLHQANENLQELKTELKEYRGKQEALAVLVKQLKAVEVHVKQVLDPSVVLSNTIRELVDFELVIKPLNEVSNQMINSQIMSSFNFQITADASEKVIANLKLIEKKLPLLPVVDVLNNENINCP